MLNIALGTGIALFVIFIVIPVAASITFLWLLYRHQKKEDIRKKERMEKFWANERNERKEQKEQKEQKKLEDKS